jgi:hypothetical protein
MAELTAVTHAKSPGCPLLRVYWYDGALTPRLNLAHATLAHMDYIKLRLGFVTGRGQQKGVDSLIVTDLIDLARNHAITDAVILSGDEDIRIGVQIAQSFGVRVHLVGITPSRGSQSLQLLRESDTTTEWDAPTVSKFLSVKSTAMPPPPAVAASAPASSGSAPSGTTPIDATTATGVDTVVATLAGSLNSSEVTALKAYWTNARGVPNEFDGKLLARGRSQLGRDLGADEKRYIRSTFTSTIQAM